MVCGPSTLVFCLLALYAVGTRYIGEPGSCFGKGVGFGGEGSTSDFLYILEQVIGLL